ncbi:MAG: hypothetical protein JW849_11480 [Phycisphaerae bacterium]|nr:hypothetical protein [Phycisphaerae bacterium]
MAKKKTHAWYAFRRTLPPWRFDELLKELTQQLPRYGVDEVIIKVDTEEFFHGQPPLGWMKNYQKLLFRIKKEMDRIGVVFSINPWITVGHCDRGRDSRKIVPGLRTMVGHDGVECMTCACPIDPVWRKHVAKVWRLYAETKPHVIWIEDDIRTFGHRPIQYGCFCPLHMKAFSDRVGKTVKREELVAAIVKPGRPHPWRKVWLDMQGELMADTVGFLAKTVHAVSPETRMGLMSSNPVNHCMEGRKWRDFAAALADGKPLYSRPPMGNYSEGELRGFYYSHNSIKATRYCLPDGVIEQTEVENVPFTKYANSVNFTFVEMAISFAFGSHGVTMNLFDHCGTPMQADPEVGAMLGAKKPFLDGLAKKAQQPGSYRGVRLLHHDRSSYVKRLAKGDEYGRLAEDGYPMMQALETLGIPTTYEASNVVAAAGQTLRTYSDAEIREMLSGGLLLDGAAARVLIERGFAKEIGLKDASPLVPMDSLGAWSAEEFFNAKFGGKQQNFMSSRMPGLSGNPSISLLKPLPKTQIVSRLVDPDAKPGYPVMTACENSLGGRIVVHAWDFGNSFGKTFLNPIRQEQYQSIIRWLSRNKPAILVRGDSGGVYPLAFRKDCDGETLLGLFNLSLDPWPSVEYELTDTRKPLRLELLSPSGKWGASKLLRATKKGKQVVVRCKTTVPFDQPLFIRVIWKT